ncbi:nucleotidyltransferase domain-containing protein [Agilicoccus flavus]|uniref:nucleotidyltransferase domain-containing protein n=1 Tax=Agilicoccus flavus TaxID=2775968 RepID=UPI001CF69C49|nr:nucleotidyltransferase [Agilicoccus flavus]
MSVLTKQFQGALSAIEPGDDAKHAALAHAEVRQVLDANEGFRSWGLDTLLIGSYSRHVSIRRIKDADVFCQLPGLPAETASQDLLVKFLTVLRGEYGDRVVKNDRSVKVEFPDYDMHVDVVPAREAGDAWEIPNKDDGWEATDPLRFGDLTSECNDKHGDYYVPTVKLLRQTRRALLGHTKPGGFFVEVAAFHAFRAIPADGAAGSPSSIAEYYTVALETMAPLLRAHADSSAPLMNPAVPGQELHVRATPSQFDAIAAAWEQAADRARAALEEIDDHAAAQTFRDLLGVTSAGEEVFQDPSKSAAALGGSLITPGYQSLPSGDSPTFG